jgi:hypothetical protein
MNQKFTSDIRKKVVEPEMVLRFVVLLALLNYYMITHDPADRSITTFWDGVLPIVGMFSDTLLPMMFVLSFTFVLVFYRVRPFAAMILSLIPVFIYAALSAGWYFGDETLNFAAIGTHGIVVLQFLAMIWREVYVPPTSTS